MYGVPLAGSLYGGSLLPLGFPVGEDQGWLVKVSGVKLSGLGQGGIRISRSLEARDTAEVRFHDLASSVAIETGEILTVYHQGLELFSGPIDRVRWVYPVNDSSSYRVGTISAGDFSSIASRRVVSVSYERQLAGDIVRSLIADWLSDDGVTSGNVEAGLLVGPVRYEFEPLETVLDAIATATGFAWRIDGDRRLDFFERSTYAAPFSLTDANCPVRDLKIEDRRKRYRNVQFVKGGLIAGSKRTRTFLGDGSRTVFELGLPIAEAPTVSVDGVYQTVRHFEDGEDEGDFWTYQRGGSSVAQNAGGSAPPAGRVVEVSFRPLLPLVVSLRDQAEINSTAAKESSSGLYEAVLVDEQTDDAEAAIGQADGYLLRYGEATVELSATCFDASIQPGHLQSVSLSEESISDEFLVQSVSIQDAGDVARVKYTATNQIAAASWADYWRKLASKASRTILGDRDIVNRYGQVGANVGVSDSDNSASGDNLAAFTADPHTAALVGLAVVGQRSEHLGYVRYNGSLIEDIA